MDIRVSGSGNIGATNVARVYGWGLAGPVVTLDVLKGFVPVLVGSLIWPESGLWWASAVAVSVFVGHCFPVYLEFRGGMAWDRCWRTFGCIACAHVGCGCGMGCRACLVWSGECCGIDCSNVLGGVTIFALCVAVGASAVCVVLTHIANIGRIVRGQEKAVIKPVRLQRSGRDADEVKPLEEAPGGKDSPAQPLWTGATQDPLSRESTEEVAPTDVE